MPVHFIYSSSKKEETEPQKEDQSYRAPSNIKRRVNVLSNLEESSVLPVLEFINSQTGLSCRLIQWTDDFSHQEGEFDLFLGICSGVIRENIYNYSSNTLNSIDPTLYRDGVLTWSKWYSCIALNTLFAEEFVLDLKELTGKITMVKPENDPLLFIVLYTLYRKYGRPILEDINGIIPLYRNSREELVFTIESGQYPAVLGIDGYFRESIEKGYPIRILYSSISELKYQVTTVSGDNIAFIPESAENRHGAEYILDFLTSSAFQSFLEKTHFTPVLLTTVASTQEPPANVLPADCDLSDVEEFKQMWTEIAFPEVIKDFVDEM